MHPKITRPTARPPNILIYSKPKMGKTTLLAALRANLILDFQHGTDWMISGKLKPYVWHLDKFDEWEEPYNYLRNEDHPFKWVSLDTTTKLTNMALRKVVNAEGDKPLPLGISLPKRGLAGEHVKIVLDKFRRLGLGVIFTANERVIPKRVEGNSIDALDGEELSLNGQVDASTVNYVPDLPEDLRKYVTSEVDVIGRLIIVKVAEPDNPARKMRRLWLGPHDDYDTGFRSDFRLPDYIDNPSIPKLYRYLTTGSGERTDNNA